MTSPLSPEAVAQMVADREAGTPGPWRMRVNKRDDQDTCDVSICGDIFVLADLNGPQYAHQHANARRIARLPDLEAAYLTLAAENATLRAEFELLTAVKNAHKMRADSHWETLRSIRVLAREGKLEHIIQHVSDAGAGYTQPDEVTMWELQAALATANDELATLQRDYDRATVTAAQFMADAVQRLETAESACEDAFMRGMSHGQHALRQCIDLVDLDALTPTADKEPKT